jgi:hypothetical protein
MCIHELSECAWCPSESTYVVRREALSALMGRPARTSVVVPQVTATIVPAPSTDDFGRYEVGYESANLKYTKPVPRLAYPHYAITTERVWQDLPMVKHYETSEYGETRFVGMVPARF